jgi:hypothetical protein
MIRHGRVCGLRGITGRLLFLSLLIAFVGYQHAAGETVCEIQAYDAQGLSPLVGRTVRATGIVTVPPGIFTPAYTSIYIRGIGNDSCGVNVFSFDPISNLELGDTITVEGVVEDYYSESYGSTTEIANLVSVTFRKGTGMAEPQVMGTGQVGREENEGRLVRVTGRVLARDGRELTVDDGSGPIIVWDQSQLFQTDPAWFGLLPGREVTVTGIVNQRDPTSPYLSDYRIWPRSPEPPFEDIMGPPCIPDTTVSRALLAITDADGNRTHIVCPECTGSENTVMIKFSGPHGARTMLRIFDTSGRCVATLEDYITSCGIVEFEWDGRNELLERLPMGLYHIVVTSTDPATGAETQEMAPLVIGRRLK